MVEVDVVVVIVDDVGMMYLHRRAQRAHRRTRETQHTQGRDTRAESTVAVTGCDEL